MSDPIPDLSQSPNPFPGSPPGYTASPNFALRVPTLADGLTLLEDHFVNQTMDVLTSIQQILRRMRDLTLFEDNHAFNPESPFADADDVTQKVRLIGENFAYMVVTVKATEHIVVPSNGDLDTLPMGTLASDALYPRSLARLQSVNTGRLASGSVLADGTVRLDSINSGTDIYPDDILSMAGMWPLLNGFDSEA